MGSFAQIDEVNYKTGPQIAGDAPDRETADHHADVPAKAAKKKTQDMPTPDIKAEADERGSVKKKAPATPVEEKRSFFERLFRPRKTDSPPATPPSPAGKPTR